MSRATTANAVNSVRTVTTIIIEEAVIVIAAVKTHAVKSPTKAGVIKPRLITQRARCPQGPLALGQALVPECFPPGRGKLLLVGLDIDQSWQDVA